jgi:hypothetical protein
MFSKKGEVGVEVEVEVPEPTAWRVTHWGSDPFSRGSYR